MRKNTRPIPLFFLGIDAGTAAVKAGVFDRDGHQVSIGVRGYPTHYERPGWAEQDPADWWSALVGAVRECLAGVEAAQIAGISADATTCTVLPMTAEGRPLRRALVWMDVRAADQAARIFASGDDALRYSLAGVNAEWMPPKALWLAEQEPQIYNQADRLLEFTDWIAYRLTGRMVMNANTAIQRWYYHTPTGGWPESFFSRIGLDGVVSKFPSEILAVGETVGPLAPPAAAEMGLPAGIPVIMGGGDAFVGLLGMGVTEPGDLGLVLGSSNVILGFSRDEFHVPGIFGSFPDALLPGLNLVEGGQASAGSILSWFKDHCARDLAHAEESGGPSAYQVLDREAASIPAGSEGLIVLDYFQGNRTPHTDSRARGAVWGLSLGSSRGHLFRALMEGIAYGLEEIVETFRGHGVPVSRVIACGGAIQSPLFMQIYSDVLGLTLSIPRTTEASLLGSAVVAAAGAGAYEDLASASRGMVKIVGECRPDSARHQEYAFSIRQYRQTYPRLKGLMHEMSGRGSAGGGAEDGKR